MLKRLRDSDLADQTADVLGADLYGANKEKIGKIDDVIVSDQSNYAIVDAGGWLNSGHYLVPADYIRSSAENPKAFHVPLTREQIQRLPELNDDVLESEDRFREYESRYRPAWSACGIDAPSSRRAPIAKTETRRRDTAPVETGARDSRIAPKRGSTTPVTAGTGTVSVYGVYHDQAKLEAAVDRLKAAAFDPNDISVVFPEKGRTDRFAMERNTKAPEGAATGGGTGLVVGGVLGWLAGIGTLAIPGIGPLLAAGPIVAALAGAGVGGAVGGIAGALVGLGMPEIEAKRYEKEIKEGRILLSVRCADPRFAGTARTILSDTDARDVFETGGRKAA